MQRPEAEERAGERPQKRHAQHRRNSQENQRERRIRTAESRDQRCAEGAVDKDQADNGQNQRKESQCSHFLLWHSPRERHDEDDGNEHERESSLQKTQPINGPENSGSSAPRGGRRMTSSSSVSASKTSEHTGSITISKNAICTGPNKIGKPNSNGRSASPAMGTCTAKMNPIALRRLS